MLFADNSIIFLEGSYDNLESLKDILRKYEVTSGQKVNLQKSSIFLANGVLRRIMGILSRLIVLNQRPLVKGTMI